MTRLVRSLRPKASLVALVADFQILKVRGGWGVTPGPERQETGESWRSVCVRLWESVSVQIITLRSGGR